MLAVVMLVAIKSAKWATSIHWKPLLGFEEMTTSPPSYGLRSPVPVPPRWIAAGQCGRACPRIYLSVDLTEISRPVTSRKV